MSDSTSDWDAGTAEPAAAPDAMNQLVNSQLAQVQAQGAGAMTTLYHFVMQADVLSVDDLSEAVEFSMSSSEEIDFSEDEAVQAQQDPAAFRNLISEKIWSKLRPDPAYAAAPRKAVYTDEDTQMGWRTTDPAQKTADDYTTLYEDRATIDTRQASAADDGRVLGPDGQPMDGSWGWVIDDQTGALLFFDPAGLQVELPDGTVADGSGSGPLYWLSRGYKIRSYHHTTPVAGFPVTGAGLVTLERGYIKKITDQSGHYRPEGEQMYQSVRQLEDDGYLLQRPGDVEGDFRDAQITLTGREGHEGRPTDKAGWLDAAEQQTPGFPTGDVTLRSEQFLQTEGNERQIRLKQALNQEINRGDASEESSDSLSSWSDSSEGPADVQHVIYPSDATAGAQPAANTIDDGDDAGEGDISDLEGDDAGEGDDSDLAAPSEAPRPRVSWEQVDWGFVRRANEALLKDTAAGQSIPYWQVGAGLIIGTEQPVTYRTLFEELRGAAGPSGTQPSGYIRVVSRGGVGSRGRIEVTGDYEEDTFKAEVRQFSNKEIRFA